jgi:hypothetical protein
LPKGRTLQLTHCSFALHLPPPLYAFGRFIWHGVHLADEAWAIAAQPVIEAKAAKFRFKSALDKNFVAAIIQPLLIIRTTQPYQIPARQAVILICQKRSASHTATTNRNK